MPPSLRTVLCTMSSPAGLSTSLLKGWRGRRRHCPHRRGPASIIGAWVAGCSTRSAGSCWWKCGSNCETAARSACHHHPARTRASCTACATGAGSFPLSRRRASARRKPSRCRAEQRALRNDFWWPPRTSRVTQLAAPQESKLANCETRGRKTGRET